MKIIGISVSESLRNPDGLRQLQMLLHRAAQVLQQEQLFKVNHN